MPSIWLRFAVEEVKSRFHGSVLGVGWIVASFLIFIAAIGLFFRGLDGPSIIQVAIGLAAYTFVVGNLTDGTNVFIQSRSWIESARLPFSIYVYKSIARSVVPFALYALIIIAFAALLASGVDPMGAPRNNSGSPWRPDPEAWMALLAIPVFLINGVWVQYLLGLLSTRSRDLQHLVSALTRLLFFTTPILWDYDQTEGGRRIAADFNPVTHFVQILRAPIIGEGNLELHWTIVGCVTVGGWLALLLIGSIWRARLTRWL